MAFKSVRCARSRLHAHDNLHDPSRPAKIRTALCARFCRVQTLRCHAQRGGSQAPTRPLSAAVASVASGLLLLSGASADAAIVFDGPARIVDGDTLYIGKDKIRLYGVDAPEKGQMCNNSNGNPYACGLASLEALKQRVGTRSVHCEVKNKDQYGRNVATCSITPNLPFQQPEDIGTYLVSNGYAVAYRAYGREYISAEEQAHSRGAGIWQGSFTEPAVWRKQERVAALNASLARNSQLGTAPAGPATAPASPATAPATTQPLASAYVSNSSAGSHGTLQDNVGNSSHTTLPEAGASSSGSGLHSAAPADKPIAVVAGVSGGRTQGAQSGLLPVGNCNGPLVKGNINSKGQKIYHTVTSGQYMRVEIDESKGERYFCSEAEAEAAGWRAAQR